MVSSKSKAGKSAARNVVLNTGRSAPGLDVVGCFFIGCFLFSLRCEVLPWRFSRDQAYSLPAHPHADRLAPLADLLVADAVDAAVNPLCLGGGEGHRIL
jgi:hypothetical protein